MSPKPFFQHVLFGLHLLVYSVFLFKFFQLSRQERECVRASGGSSSTLCSYGGKLVPLRRQPPLPRRPDPRPRHRPPHLLLCFWRMIWMTP
ncbi:hypothetical protein LINPERPRIM_LOCUS15378 [Linum perenne]